MVKSSDVVLILVAVLFPPAAAAIVTGCSFDLLISVLLTFLGYIPGLIHSLWLIYEKIHAEERFGAGGFIYIGNGHYEPLYSSSESAPVQPAPQNYGSTNEN
ncbi:hypothetical protein HYPSUDRAFT_36053 [Hypholoma sublateritium FD-334 SS-4]|uniref:Stress response RCI peptide n=1 Tax=Hypholoma sublateritium (strain FD-334 SS-4) TaxID=945553 RepID=A0A0D2Q5N3_HYPSF|nr:hypothetical protein HYPSUDRAFT_36053 [Hypholoma sublateritium FD-334 SS-4]